MSDFYEELPAAFVLDDRARAREDREYDQLEVLPGDTDWALTDEDTARLMGMW